MIDARDLERNLPNDGIEGERNFFTPTRQLILMGKFYSLVNVNIAYTKTNYNEKHEIFSLGI